MSVHDGREATLDEVLFAAKVSMAIGEWKKIKEQAELFCTLKAETQEEKWSEYFDIDFFEKATADAFEVLKVYRDKDSVPKMLVKLFEVLAGFSNIEYLKSWRNGELQFRTSIAKALSELASEKVCYDEEDEENTCIVFYMDECQSEVEPGYYIYDIKTFLYYFLGKEKPW